ncbi:uncharacterized protein TRAVEDRAFT_49270 [Trametes versicolor FP-101664 SS1]|uniref:uncharacterized protein n=1 Tax=Trametes versicolor (strain FP-101664) TaxID=717944 RepID=UPI0004622305|nr:uncharacterized protein TRAVEDRAFT_49270 [Trametes versicolor FP-101664 SS1]EIW56446.1 hypothetical protein TRAVEDRAFT_49270 [Trametes versicolor FP-101664 SS1]
MSAPRRAALHGARRASYRGADTSTPRPATRSPPYNASNRRVTRGRSSDPRRPLTPVGGSPRSSRRARHLGAARAALQD